MEQEKWSLSLREKVGTSIAILGILLLIATPLLLPWREQSEDAAKTVGTLGSLGVAFVFLGILLVVLSRPGPRRPKEKES